MTISQGRTSEDWSLALFETLRAGDVSRISHVPDAGHARLISLCEAEPSMTVIGLTSEEEGVGVSAGAWLGGARAALLMQSSGLGNCVNAISSLADSGRFPLLMAITMRGEWGEFNPWQVPPARAARGVLDALDCRTIEVQNALEAGETATAAISLAFDSDQRVALLLPQRLIGTKAFQ